MISQNAIFPLDTLPSKGGDMRIWHEDIQGTRWYFVDRAYRKPDGSSTHFKRKTDDPVQHARHVIEAQSILGECSLTSKRFAEIVHIYIEEKGTGGFNQACYDRAVKEFGRLFPDKPSFAVAYAQYASKLDAESMAINTANNYKTVVRSVCNYGFKTSRCVNPSVRDYGLKKGTERDRILSAGEWLTLNNKLLEIKSPIFEHVNFAGVNPIRKRDLFNLRRDDLKMNLVNDRRIWSIQFVAQKTATDRRGRKITMLPNVTPEFLQYVAGLPGDCPWLFPVVGVKGNGEITKLKPGKWRKVQDSDKHFNSVIDACNIQDFTWHDLKHCAETHMIRQGYHYEDLQKLGIQLSSKTQRIYDNRDQLEIIANLKCSTFVAPEKQVNE